LKIFLSVILCIKHPSVLQCQPQQAGSTPWWLPRRSKSQRRSVEVRTEQRQNFPWLLI